MMLGRFVLTAALLAASAPAQPIQASAAGSTPQPALLKVEVLPMGAGSLNANLSLIEGEDEAVLVDAPFTMADAHRVVAAILESGKHLTTVFITHDHPDHFFSMEVIQEAFPDARIVAHPEVVADIWRSLPFKVKRWSPMLGANGPRHPTAPAALTGDTIMLEGQPLKVLGPEQGDHPHATALWAPSIGALFAGDLVFNQVYLWLGEHDAAAEDAWAKSLDRLAALKPRMVVAGHSKPGTPNDASGIAFSRAYLDAWRADVPKARDSADLRRRMQAQFPHAIDVLGDFILGTSSRVAMEEEPLWKE